MNLYEAFYEGLIVDEEFIYFVLSNLWETKCDLFFIGVGIIETQ